MLYFDNNATTQIDARVLETLNEALVKFYGNAGSIYNYGAESKRLMQKARTQLAELLKASSDNIVFTSCATESNNAVINSCISFEPSKKHIITTSVEHPSIISPLRALEKRGYRIDYLSVDGNGKIDLLELSSKLCTDTVLVSIMLVNNETGNIYPIKEAVDVVKNFCPSIFFHTDAVQAVGKIDIDVHQLGVDFLSFSGHKFHAPKGIGGLFIKEPKNFIPLVYGGGQESGLRSGTENIPSIVAIGKAAEIIDIKEEAASMSFLRDKIERAVVTMFPETRVIGDAENRVCSTTNLLIPNTNGVALVAALGECDVCISSGSACSAKDKGQSHVLDAMGISGKSVRISLSRFTTKQDVQRFIPILLQAIKKLQGKE